MGHSAAVEYPFVFLPAEFGQDTIHLVWSVLLEGKTQILKTFHSFTY